jgi:hypothetical protein
VSLQGSTARIFRLRAVIWICAGAEGREKHPEMGWEREWKSTGEIQLPPSWSDVRVCRATSKARPIPQEIPEVLNGFRD